MENIKQLRNTTGAGPATFSDILIINKLTKIIWI